MGELHLQNPACRHFLTTESTEARAQKRQAFKDADRDIANRQTALATAPPNAPSNALSKALGGPFSS